MCKHFVLETCRQMPPSLSAPFLGQVVAEWTDDEVFGWGNRPVYTNFAQIYYYFYWVSMPTATTLVFCAGNVALTIGAELRQIQVRS